MKRANIYMDYAASAPELWASRWAAFRAGGLFGNPSSIHKEGLRSAEALKEARESLARSLSAHADEIVLCGSGTESDNMAVMGAFKHARLDPAFKGRDVHIITTAIEHPAIFEACKHLESVGAQVTYLSVGNDGRIDLKELRKAFRPNTVLVSIAYANNEIGTVQPVREIAKEIRHYKKESGQTTYPLFHTDACQAAQYENINMEQIGADMLTLNGTKIGGPRGTALLYVRRGTPIAPMFYGGGQEKNLRSGTENVPGVVGLAAALASVQKIRAKESARLETLRDYATIEIEKRIPGARINGSRNHRLPNNVHISIPRIASELLVLELDAKGIAVSAGSACSSAKDTSSHVLEALYGKEDDKKYGSIRLSFGRKTTKKQIDTVLESLEGIVKKYKNFH
jgi:cysteine desulfurase